MDQHKKKDALARTPFFYVSMRIGIYLLASARSVMMMSPANVVLKCR